MYDKHRPWPSFFHKVVEIDHSNHRLDYDVSIERWLYCAGHSGTWLQVLTLPLGHWDFSGIFLGMKMVDVLASKCGSSTIMPFRIWAKSKTLLIGLSQRLALPHRKQKRRFRQAVCHRGQGGAVAINTTDIIEKARYSSIASTHTIRSHQTVLNCIISHTLLIYILVRPQYWHKQHPATCANKFDPGSHDSTRQEKKTRHGPYIKQQRPVICRLRSVTSWRTIFPN